MKINSKIRYEFNKRFANGEQYISYGYNKIEDNLSLPYIWQERETYNHILPIIEMLKAKYKNKITNKLLYGENGLVEMLIPTQRAYNFLINRSIELAKSNQQIGDLNKQQEILLREFEEIVKCFEYGLREVDND